VQGLAAASSPSNSSIGGISASESLPGSCQKLGVASVVKKYQKAKALLHAQFQEAQRLKQAAVSERARAEAAAQQLAAVQQQMEARDAAAAVARAGMKQLQQEVRSLGSLMHVYWFRKSRLPHWSQDADGKRLLSSFSYHLLLTLNMQSSNTVLNTALSSVHIHSAECTLLDRCSAVSLAFQHLVCICLCCPMVLSGAATTFHICPCKQ